MATIPSRGKSLRRSGGESRSDWEPTELAKFIERVEGEADATGDPTESEMGRLLADADFLAVAPAEPLARLAVGFRGRVDHPTAQILERCVHELGSLNPLDRLALLRLVALPRRPPSL